MTRISFSVKTSYQNKRYYLNVNHEFLHVNILMEDRKPFQMKFSKVMMIYGDFLVISSIPAYFTLIKCCSIQGSA